MKRILNVISLAFISFLIPFSMVDGQVKKNEQRIKVLVTDGSDTKTVIDTVFKDDLKRDTIVLKDGIVLFIGNRSKKDNFITTDGTEHIFVTVTSDENNMKDEAVKEVTVVTSDPAEWTANETAKKIFVYTDDSTAGNISGEHQKIIKWSGEGDAGSGENLYIITGKTVTGKDGGESNTYSIQTDVSDNKESDSENTKYVITKSGMVITIEGQEYSKVKQLAKEIEGKIDATSDAIEKKENNKR